MAGKGEKMPNHCHGEDRIKKDRRSTKEGEKGFKGKRAALTKTTRKAAMVRDELGWGQAWGNVFGN